jgi:hypothetical protein
LDYNITRNVAEVELDFTSAMLQAMLRVTMSEVDKWRNFAKAGNVARDVAVDT